MANDMIKQDINFLEYPLWFQDKDTAHQAEGYVWQDQEGFTYRAGYKQPVKIDAILLYALLLHSQLNDWQHDFTITRYQLIKECGLDPKQSYWYHRLLEGLERWTSVIVRFKGTFYDGIAYQVMQFHIIDSWKIDENTKQLHIRFSPEFLQQIQNSNYFKLIEFNKFKQLQSSLATRLYEILVKNFQGRDKWEIESLKLAQKIPMDKQYAADIIPKIKAAVNRINERTELKLNLEIRRPQRGKAIFVFTKLSDNQKKAEPTEGPKVLDVPKKQHEELKKLLELVPEEYRFKKTVLEMISRSLRKHDESYVRRNILYANKNVTTNYRAYLSKTLQKDWAADQQDLPGIRPSLRAEQVDQNTSIPQERPITLQDLGIPAEKRWNFEELLQMVPQKERENEWIQRLISKELDEKGYEYVLWNILYSNKHALGSYYTMLKTALESNVGGINRKMVLNKPLPSSPQ